MKEKSISSATLCDYIRICPHCLKVSDIVTPKRAVMRRVAKAFLTFDFDWESENVNMYVCDTPKDADAEDKYRMKGAFWTIQKIVVQICVTPGFEGLRRVLFFKSRNRENEKAVREMLLPAAAYQIFHDKIFCYGLTVDGMTEQALDLERLYKEARDMATDYPLTLESKRTGETWTAKFYA